jgi:hypothetical protein
LNLFFLQLHLQAEVKAVAQMYQMVMVLQVVLAVVPVNQLAVATQQDQVTHLQLLHLKAITAA